MKRVKRIWLPLQSERTQDGVSGLLDICEYEDRIHRVSGWSNVFKKSLFSQQQQATCESGASVNRLKHVKSWHDVKLDPVNFHNTH